MSDGRIRVLVVDDQALVRGGITALLALFEGLEVVGEADSGPAALAAVPTLAPDVMLLDVRMPGMGGVDVIAALAAQAALPPTLLLTTFEDDIALIAGVKAGARGYLLKGVTPEILVEAIRTVAAGGTYLVAPLASAADQPRLDPAWRDEAFDTPDSLTGRERDVLKLMASGIDNRGIAQALGLGDGTVRNHVSNIFSKLGVTDRTKAVLYALQKRLV